MQERRTFRVLHLFSGYRRLEDVEWWCNVLSEAEGLHVEIWSIDVAPCPGWDLSQGWLVETLLGAIRVGVFHAMVAGPRAGPGRGRSSFGRVLDPGLSEPGRNLGEGRTSR